MRKKILLACLLLVCAAALFFLFRRPADPPESAVLLLDGQALSSPVLSPEKQGDLRVILTLDGQQIADLPFGESHRLEIRQPGGEENVLLLTGDSVRMESANCEGQDCVHMEEVTRGNLETRVLFGMIVCLPHRLSVEVR